MSGICVECRFWCGWDGCCMCGGSECFLAEVAADKVACGCFLPEQEGGEE